MTDLSTGAVLAISFFCVIGIGALILGIILYRRQSTPPNDLYLTQVKRPFPADTDPASSPSSYSAKQPQPELARAVHGRSETSIPSQIGNWFNTVIPPQFSLKPSSTKKKSVLPADVSKRLKSAMLDAHNHLEDVNYGKIVPNFFVVEVSPENYAQNYQPIEQQACAQWQQRLLNALSTANSRQGRKAFRFGGAVEVNVRSVADLSEQEVRILSQIRSDGTDEEKSQIAYLEQIPDGRHWSLKMGINTLGRSSQSNISLDSPIIQERGLISNNHAYIRAENDSFTIFDGALGGKNSRSGTFVNSQSVSESGQKLSDGNVIILAALDREHPRPDTLGAAGFIFHTK